MQRPAALPCNWHDLPGHFRPLRAPPPLPPPPRKRPQEAQLEALVGSLRLSVEDMRQQAHRLGREEWSEAEVGARGRPSGAGLCPACGVVWTGPPLPLSGALPREHRLLQPCLRPALALPCHPALATHFPQAARFCAALERLPSGQQWLFCWDGAAMAALPGEQARAPGASAAGSGGASFIADATPERVQERLAEAMSCRAEDVRNLVSACGVASRGGVPWRACSPNPDGAPVVKRAPRCFGDRVCTFSVCNQRTLPLVPAMRVSFAGSTS